MHEGKHHKMTPERKQAVIDCLEKGICEGVSNLTDEEINQLVEDSWKWD